MYPMTTATCLRTSYHWHNLLTTGGKYCSNFSVDTHRLFFWTRKHWTFAMMLNVSDTWTRHFEPFWTILNQPPCLNAGHMFLLNDIFITSNPEQFILVSTYRNTEIQRVSPVIKFCFWHMLFYHTSSIYTRFGQPYQ